jgi:DNA invertase Pin-like site-specific DNA recombinase
VRELIRERTGEGRKRAMANGVKFGRKPKLSDYQRQEAIKQGCRGNPGIDCQELRGRYFDDFAALNVQLINIEQKSADARRNVAILAGSGLPDVNDGPLLPAGWAIAVLVA